MIPYQIDPSLHHSELPLESLEDGFSPPAAEEATPSDGSKAQDEAEDASTLLGDKSPF